MTNQCSSLSKPKTSRYTYVFSVIVPVYNTAPWIEETITSVIEQSLAFCDNIQLILVNNGSTDESGLICQKFAYNYPENIVYIDLPQNVGPSGARNVGLDSVSGEYICFLDSDDYLSKNALELGVSFFEKAPEEIACVAIRTRCFEAIDDWEIYDYRFKQTGIIDIFEYPTYFQFPATQAFLRTERVKRYRFDTRLLHSEDMLYINKIILETGKYGILKEAIYYYRKRKTSGSLVSLSPKSRPWYCPPFRFNYLVLMDLSRHIYGKIINYVQELIMFELQWRFTNRLLESLSREELAEYCDLLHQALQEIDDRIILHQKSISVKQKVAALSLKYGYNVLENSQLIGLDLCYEGLALWNIAETPSIRIRAIDEVSNGIKVNCELIQPIPFNKLQFWVVDMVGMQYPIFCKPLERADYLENFLLGQCEMTFEIPIRVGEYKICCLLYGHNFELKYECDLTKHLKREAAYLSFNGSSFFLKVEKLRGSQIMLSAEPGEGEVKVSKTRSLLKKLLPPPVNTFNREISAVKDTIIQQGAESEHYIQESEEHLRHLLDDHLKKILQYAETQTEFCSSVKNGEEQLRLLVEKQNLEINQLKDMIHRNQELLKKLVQKTDILQNMQQGISDTQNQQLQELISLKKLNTESASVIQEQLVQNFETLKTRQIRTMKLPILSFEVHLTEHCNLNCKGCDHFCPVAEPAFTDLSVFTKDFQRLSELFAGEAREIHLLGGEPLLNPDIEQFCQIARENFPRAVIDIVTNGLLLCQMPDSFWFCCKENRIGIRPTKYPVNVDYSGAEKKAHAFGVDYVYFNDSKQLKTMTHNRYDLDGLQDPRQSFADCSRANKCIYLADGKLYTCTFIPNIHHFNKFFGTDIPVSERDYIDIYKASSADEILEFLSHPVPFCRFCNIAGAELDQPWGISKRQMDEWT